MDSLFRMYSQTKPVTAAVVMSLFEEGAFFLDEPVSKWLPEFENPRVAVYPAAEDRVLAIAEVPLFAHLGETWNYASDFDVLSLFRFYDSEDWRTKRNARPRLRESVGVRSRKLVLGVHNIHGDDPPHRIRRQS